MRTTLQIDDDLLQVVRNLALRQRRTCGEVVSDLLRKALMPEQVAEQRNGITLFPKRGDASTPKPRYTLAELLAASDYSQSPEEREWVDAPAVGGEQI